ncbi:MAG: lipoprotein-releasing ABC transporter permease subunit [Proteobacteria bacterium]|nr:lipoprotein-releasing ABC transporter permease subunit [Pseudomonadota bacterium]
MLEWGIAARYLRSRREGFISLIAWLSLIGIALGVATLIIVMSVMNGFRAELLDRILGVSGHVVVRSADGPVADYEALAGRIVALPEVVEAVPVIEGQVMALAGNVARGALVRGVRAVDLDANDLIAGHIVEGSLDGFRNGGGVVVGSRLAGGLGLGVGDRITLVAPETNATPFGTAPRMKAWPIAAIFEVGMFEYDSGLVYAPLDGVQAFFRMNGLVAAVEVRITNPEAPEQVRRAILSLQPGLRVHDWRDTNVQFFNALEVERNVMFLILTLIILVAALNVISGLVMLVKDKRGDIAILRTMGASRGMVLRVFFLAGAAVGVIGTLAGFLLGLGFAANIEVIRQWIQALLGTELFSAEVYFLSQLPAVVDPVEVAAVVAMALGLSFLATLYPSWRAARTDPVEVLRSE